jgi:hypothetical protein
MPWIFNDTISGYKNMFLEKQLQARQSTLGAFFKKVDNYPENEPKPDPFTST